MGAFINFLDTISHTEAGIVSENQQLVNEITDSSIENLRVTKYIHLINIKLGVLNLQIFK